MDVYIKVLNTSFFLIAYNEALSYHYPVKISFIFYYIFRKYISNFMSISGFKLQC